MCTHRHISVFFPTDIWLLCKASKGFEELCEGLFQELPRSFARLLGTWRDFENPLYRSHFMKPQLASQSPYKEGILQSLCKEWDSYTHTDIHKYAHFSHCSTDMGVLCKDPRDFDRLHEAPTQRELCEAPRGFKWLCKGPHIQGDLGSTLQALNKMS